MMGRLKKMNKAEEIEKLLAKFPKVREPLSKEYFEIYEKHYSENRNAQTKASRASMFMERWGHKKVAQTSRGGGNS